MYFRTLLNFEMNTNGFPSVIGTCQGANIWPGCHNDIMATCSDTKQAPGCILLISFKQLWFSVILRGVLKFLQIAAKVWFSAVERTEVLAQWKKQEADSSYTRQECLQSRLQRGSGCCSLAWRGVKSHPTEGGLNMQGQGKSRECSLGDLLYH